jgi:hypothetical protein
MDTLNCGILRHDSGYKIVSGTSCFHLQEKKKRFVLGSFMIGDVIGLNLQDVQTVDCVTLFCGFPQSGQNIVSTLSQNKALAPPAPNPPSPFIDDPLFFDATRTHLKKRR